jgi:hypothetical protein
MRRPIQIVRSLNETIGFLILDDLTLARRHPRVASQRGSLGRCGPCAIKPRQRKSLAVLPVDEKEIALEEFERDEGKSRRPAGADRGTCVTDEDEVAIGQQPAIAIAGIGFVATSRPARAPSASSRGRPRGVAITTEPISASRGERKTHCGHSPGAPTHHAKTLDAPAPSPRRRSDLLPAAAPPRQPLLQKTMTRRRSAKSRMAAPFLVLLSNLCSDPAATALLQPLVLQLLAKATIPAVR